MSPACMSQGPGSAYVLKGSRCPEAPGVDQRQNPGGAPASRGPKASADHSGSCVRRPKVQDQLRKPCQDRVRDVAGGPEWPTPCLRSLMKRAIATASLAVAPIAALAAYAQVPSVAPIPSVAPSIAPSTSPASSVAPSSSAVAPWITPSLVPSVAPPARNPSPHRINKRES